MNSRDSKRQEKHRQYLRIDRSTYLPDRHSHLLHDPEARLILITLADLLVVHDKHRRNHERRTEKDTDEEKPGVGGKKIVKLRLNAGTAIGLIPVTGFKGFADTVSDPVTQPGLFVTASDGIKSDTEVRKRPSLLRPVP